MGLLKKSPFVIAKASAVCWSAKNGSKKVNVVYNFRGSELGGNGHCMAA